MVIELVSFLNDKIKFYLNNCLYLATIIDFQQILRENGEKDFFILVNKKN